MYSSLQPSISTNKYLNRHDFISLLLAAIEVREWRYARRLATAWLASFPGDIPIKYHYAQSIIQDEHFLSPRQALDILEQLCSLDPEYYQAQILWLSLNQKEPNESHFVSKGCVIALSNNQEQLTNKGEMAPIWARQLYEARSALSKYLSGGLPSIEKAEYAIHQALIENPDTPLAAVTHLNIMAAKADLPSQAILSLAQIYHARWPECLQFRLVLADRLMDSGDSASAVELLHEVVAKDLTGQVIKRLWGANHPYQTLWPETIEIAPNSLTSPQNIPIPALVAARLGWNQIPALATEITSQENSAANLPDPEIPNVLSAVLNQSTYSDISNQPITKVLPVPRKQRSKLISEPVRAVQSEFVKLAHQLKIPSLANMDGRFPVYVILTTRTGLEKQYGEKGAALLDDELKKLARAIRGQRINHETWGAILLYADDPEYTSFFGLQPVPYNDPWALKLLLADIDNALGHGGEKIGSILIIGGSEVVPFHRLPNPVDDADAEVLSDNPYASLGENYFVLEWPIGRLPGSSSNDPSGLVTAIRKIIHIYLEKRKTQPWYLRIFTSIRELIRQKSSHFQSSFGYTAAVWRRASLAVFRTIGNPQDLLVSPPVHACDPNNSAPSPPSDVEKQTDKSSCLFMPGTRLAYFNLHGIPDSAFWYGHRDPSEPLEGVEFPIALRPQDVRNGGSAPELVFSEACYGAHILNKSVDEALSLKFLASGSHAVIGSTCISYGSIAAPLSAADLLGRIFWGLLEEGFQIGEAVRRAKLQLIREMHRRQGYLDPEDQKTLISFVLFGDPLAQPFRSQKKSKSLYRNRELPPEIKTVSENPQPEGANGPISSEIIAHVKSIVSQYLPGMADAQLRLTQSQVGLTNMTPESPYPSAETPTLMGHVASRRVVSLSKNIKQSNLNHAQYARLTMDASGKLLKLTVSR